MFKSGNSLINVYRSDYAGTNKATAVTWAVGAELENVVRALTAKGRQIRTLRHAGHAARE